MEIAATLIARNEARCIERCLNSMRPWVDRMVVLDTGSTDGTPDLAKQCGAEVHHFAWPDDFSVARNHALDLVDADWHLILDADDYIEHGGHLLRPWCEGPPRLGRLCIHSTFDDPANTFGGGVSTSRNWVTRLVPRGARFLGRVHEQVVSPLPRERLEIHLAHDGYRDAQLTRKHDRNRKLLLLDLAERPDDPYVTYQLGCEAEGGNDFMAAREWYAQSFAQTPSQANWLHDLLVRFLHCLGQAGRVDEGLALANAQMSNWQDSPDFFFVVGNLALDRAMLAPEEALSHWLPLAVSCWERCLAIGERPDLEGAVEGRGSHLARHNLSVIEAQVAQFAR